MSVPADRSDPRKFAEKAETLAHWLSLRPLTPAEAEEGVNLLLDLARALLAALDREAEERDATMHVLDGFNAPTESGGVTLNVIGRTRALRSKLEARAEAAEKALRDYDGVMKQAVSELARHAKELSGWQREPLDDAVNAMRATRKRDQRALAAAAGSEESVSDQAPPSEHDQLVWMTERLTVVEAALDECRRERGIVLTHDELVALASALDAIAATPVVPDLEVYYAVVQKIMAAELAAR